MKAKQMDTEKWLKNKSEDKSKKPNCSKSPYSKRRDLDEKNQLHELYSEMKQTKTPWEGERKMSKVIEIQEIYNKWNI